jgi:dienelactone hydrolase
MVTLLRAAPIAFMMIMAATVAMAAERVTFAGEGLMLRAMLYRPNGPGPFPAVIALHGCAGLYGHDDSLSPRHADWAERLVAAGFIVLFPDSFGSRGADSQCKTDDRVTRPAARRPNRAIGTRACRS